MGKAEFASGVDKLTNYISDMIDYNRIIQVYLNMTNTPQTRIEIFNKIEPLKKLLDKILKKFEELTDKFMNVDDADMYKRFFVKTLRSEALYDLIEEQFRKNNLFVITERDVENQLMDIIRENPVVGDIIKDNGLDLKPPSTPPASSASSSTCCGCSGGSSCGGTATTSGGSGWCSSWITTCLAITIFNATCRSGGCTSGGCTSGGPGISSNCSICQCPARGKTCAICQYDQKFLKL
jgi:hypothetical protein